MTAETTAAAGDFTQQTPEEIEAVMALLRREGLFTDTHRIAYLGLLDPPRGAERAEVSRDRRFRVFILDTEGGKPQDVVVSAARDEVLSNRELDSEVDGEFPVMEEEFELVEAVLAEDPDWQAAIAKRDIPIEEVRVAPLSAGSSSTRRRRDAASCAASPSTSSMRPTPPGPTRSTGSWPTWTSPTAPWTRSSTSGSCRSRPSTATTPSRT